MKFDNLATAIRPRTNAESIDLGFRLASSHFLGCWLPLFSLLLLIALPCYLIGKDFNPFWMYLVLWWLKPLWEPISLLVLSRRIFGETLNYRQTLQAWLTQSWPQMLLNLTWRRFSLARNFDLPVSLLEKLTGKQRRQRLNALHGDNLSATFALAGLGSTIEAVMMAAASYSSSFLFKFKYLQSPGYIDEHFESVTFFSYALAISLVAPYFSASGFTLYLNRRTRLEGWDIELQFKQLSQRIQARTLIKSSALTLLLLLTPMTAQEVQAEPQISSQQARQLILESMTGKEFYSEEKQQKVIEKHPDKPEENEKFKKFAEWLADWLKHFFKDEKSAPSFNAVAELIRISIWVIAALLIIYLIWRYHDYIPIWRQTGSQKTPRRAAAPNELFGLDIRHTALPADIPTAAQAAWQQQNYREAFSLLYRGALSICVNQFKLEFQSHHTEGDCSLILSQAKPELSGYFAELTQHWKVIAYGHQLPELDFSALCEQWRSHFSGVTHVKPD